MVITDLLEKLDRKSSIETAPIITNFRAVVMNNSDTLILSIKSNTIKARVKKRVI